MLALDLVRHAQMTPNHFTSGLSPIPASSLRQRHFDPGEQQERTKYIQQPFELGNQPATGEDHDGTQDNMRPERRTPARGVAEPQARRSN